MITKKGLDTIVDYLQEISARYGYPSDPEYNNSELYLRNRNIHDAETIEFIKSLAYQINKGIEAALEEVHYQAETNNIELD